MKAKRMIILLCVATVACALGSWIVYGKIVADKAAQETCGRNLRFIAGAKDVAGQELHLSVGSMVSTQILVDYMIGGWRPCPSGGTYNVNPLGKDPTCNVRGHVIAP